MAWVESMSFCASLSRRLEVLKLDWNSLKRKLLELASIDDKLSRLLASSTILYESANINSQFFLFTLTLVN